MTDISKAIRWNLNEQLIIAQSRWRSEGAASPQVGPGQHTGGGPGSEAPRNLRNLAFSGYQIRPKTALIERILTSCLYFSLQQMTIFIGINGDNPIWLMRTEKN